MMLLDFSRIGSETKQSGGLGGGVKWISERVAFSQFSDSEINYCS
jgi:hypothetical protein